MRLYRTAIGFLLVVVAVGGWALNRELALNLQLMERPPARPPAQPGAAEAGTIQVIDLGRRIEAMGRRAPDLADWSETYWSAPGSTVHLHLMGKRQICPLHIHRRTQEATVLVSGTAEITHIYNQGGALSERRGRHPPGTLIATPPLCGHEFINPSPDAMLANLVFALPRFDGNHYVRRDDSRMLGGAAPFIHHPAQDLERLGATTRSSEIRETPAVEGRLSLLLLRGEHLLDLDARRSVVGYVAAGDGEVRHDGHATPLHERSLLLARSPHPVRLTLRAAEQGRMAVFLFRPPPDE